LEELPGEDRQHGFGLVEHHVLQLVGLGRPRSRLRSGLLEIEMQGPTYMVSAQASSDSSISATPRKSPSVAPGCVAWMASIPFWMPPRYFRVSPAMLWDRARYMQTSPIEKSHGRLRPSRSSSWEASRKAAAMIDRQKPTKSELMAGR
jgi:hypothetical protein